MDMNEDSKSKDQLIRELARLRLEIGELKREAKALQKREEAFREASILGKLESTGILAGGMAHDFNNLLTTILGNIELAGMKSVGGDGGSHYLAAAQKAVRSAQGLTRQLITFAEGGAPVQESLSLTHLLQEQSLLALSGSAIDCKFDMPDDLLPVWADEIQIGQVVRNLVLNAWEAMPDGGTVTVTAQNVVVEAMPDTALPAGEYVKISVADQGSGIPEEILTRIFDPYFSTKNRCDHKGMGLGLSICHSILKKHRGTLEVKSSPGTGTTCHFYLPAIRNVPEPQKIKAPETLTEPGRILVMDDEENVRELTQALLQHFGYDVDLAEDGESALALYAQKKQEGRPFDIVLLDLTVRRGMGGHEAFGEMFKIDPEVKAIVMSGYSSDPVIMDYERYGFKGALAKPYQAGDLRREIIRIIGT